MFSLLAKILGGTAPKLSARTMDSVLISKHSMKV